MGSISPIRIGIAVVCLVLTGAAVHYQSHAYSAVKRVSLHEALANIHAWQIMRSIPLDTTIVEELALDDYVNLQFVNDAHQAQLYIGYYQNAKKVGAAHSPLVCFPGQGWQLSEFVEADLDTEMGVIHLNRVTAILGDHKELLIYWFQSYDRTSRGTLLQKLNTIQSKFLHRREDNAFVRVTVPLNGLTVEEAFQIGKRFIRQLYPHFLGYVKEDAG